MNFKRKAMFGNAAGNFLFLFLFLMPALKSDVHYFRLVDWKRKVASGDRGLKHVLEGC